jgi:disulfide bond formation protein DsbB
MKKLIDYAGYVVFGVALSATLGSLVMSEVFHLPPCLLCWYQRIFMYPLVVILGVAILRRDGSWPLTTIILAGIGWLIALYHTLLQWSILPSTLAPCTIGESCLTLQINWLGFITIPFMSLMAFTVILAAAYVYMKGDRNE